MYNIDLICIGKLKEDYLRGACAEYSKRLSAFCKLKITELTPSRIPDDPSQAQIDAALADEGRIEDFEGVWLSPVADALEKTEKRAD